MQHFNYLQTSHHMYRLLLTSQIRGVVSNFSCGKKSRVVRMIISRCRTMV